MPSEESEEYSDGEQRMDSAWTEGVDDVEWQIHEHVEIGDIDDPTTYVCTKCGNEGLTTDFDHGFVCLECNEPRPVKLVEVEDEKELVTDGGTQQTAVERPDGLPDEVYRIEDEDPPTCSNERRGLRSTPAATISTIYQIRCGGSTSKTRAAGSLPPFVTTRTASPDSVSLSTTRK